jgi:hypothetical protein
VKVKLTVVLLFSWVVTTGQPRKTENLVIITMDGFRWQELFHGADSSIFFNPEFVTDSASVKKFWHSSNQVRRETLLPFFWEVIGRQGQLYGNRQHDNKVNCSNPHWFSYPGYSELFTGFVDRRIRSNRKIINPHSNVLEFINALPEYNGKVAAFSTWETLPYILRAEQAGIVNNCGKGMAVGDSLSQSEKLLNELKQLMNPSGERMDVFSFYYAFEYLKRERPRVLYIGLDETDQHGHGGRYDKYLMAANRTDQMIRTLWDWLQSDPQYRDKTTLIITTDHGRGKGSRNSWKVHGRLAFGSGQIWFAVLGPDTPALGEVKEDSQYFQNQLARTAAAFLQLDYQNVEPVGEIIESTLHKPATLTTR